MARKIIIDTDPGVDDAMAIFFALRSPELDVLGLTTVFGNVHTPLATINALRLLDIAERPDIPVAQGASHPLAREFHTPADFVHGADGQGDLNLPQSKYDAVPESAAEFIIETVMAHPGEVTLVPIGPLTNIALALRLDPRLVENVDQIVLMGGNAFGNGNASPAAEANIFHDPEAADVVFGAGWSVTMVGLDVTHKVFMPASHIARYAQANNPLAKHIAASIPFYLQFHRDTYKIDGIHIHDSSAIAYLLAPDAFTTEQLPVRVATMGISAGKTWMSRGIAGNLEPWEGRPLVNICLGVDADRTMALEAERLLYDQP